MQPISTDNCCSFWIHKLQQLFCLKLFHCLNHHIHNIQINDIMWLRSRWLICLLLVEPNTVKYYISLFNNMSYKFLHNHVIDFFMIISETKTRKDIIGCIVHHHAPLPTSSSIILFVIHVKNSVFVRVVIDSPLQKFCDGLVINGEQLICSTDFSLPEPCTTDNADMPIILI